MSNAARYYNLFNGEKRYTALRFLAGDGLQSRELNEIQDTLRHQIEGVAASILSEGDRIEGAGIAVDNDAGEVTLETGRVFLRGAVRTVDEVTMAIPMNERVAVGLRFTSEIITHLEDPSLRDPSTDTRNANEPGAQRVRETVTWGYEGESTSDGSDADFHAIYTVDNGILENLDTPPALDSVIQAIARYDREANGSYLVSGLGTSYLYRQRDDGSNFTSDAVVADPAAFIDHADAAFIFDLSDGVGNVNGYKVEKTQSQRLLWEHDPDLRPVNAEPHNFNDGGSGTLVIETNRAPIAEVQEVVITKEATETVTHGAFSGASDSLGHTSVVSIVSVSQGGTTYDEGTDYTRSGDQIDWSAPGDEPAPGSTYDVTYRYIDNVTPDAIDDTTVTVSGAVTGTTVFIDYSWKLPRVDVLVMDGEGALTRFRGVSQADNPQVPTVPQDLLPLASIEFDWYLSQDPVVRQSGVRAVPVSDLYEMQEKIDDLFQLVAIEQLRNDTNQSDQTAKKGVFVDPLFDEDLRDSGVAQTGAIVDGTLTLGINNAVFEPNLDVLDLTDADIDTPDLPLLQNIASTNVVLEQLKSTGAMKINPYQNFEVLPPQVVLRPAVDNWTVVERNITSVVTRSFIRHRVRHINRQRTINLGGRGRVQVVNSFRTSTSRNVTNARVVTSPRELISETGRPATVARSRDVRFILRKLAPNERITSVTLDGIDVTPSPEVVANGSGVASGSFTVPSGLPTGQKKVVFTGHFGSEGEATYTANGWLVTRHFRSVRSWVGTRTRVITSTTTSVVRRIDPLAQTFILDGDQFLTDVDVWFDQLGDTEQDVIVQVRETTVGLPNDTVLAETTVDMSAVNTSGSTKVSFTPVPLNSGQEYALVFLTEDADHSLRIAELGKFDSERGEWVTAQAYRIGVLLSSSNARTWTPHQNRDLKFRLHTATFDTAPRRIPCGQVALTNASDILILADVERPSSDCDAYFQLEAVDGTIFEFPEGEAINLAERLDETLDVFAVIESSATHTPLLSPNIQIISGDLQTAGDYVSRAFIADANFDGVVILDALLPGSSTLRVYMEDGVADTWTELTLAEAEPVGDGFEERRYEAANLNGIDADTHTRIKLEFTGDEANRPFFQNIKGFAK